MVLHILIRLRKCDGGRPKCSTCLKKFRKCGYDVADRAAAAAAAAERLAMLQSFVDGLRSSSLDQANHRLQRWRDSDGQICSVSELLNTPITEIGSSTEGSPGQVLRSLPSSDLTDRCVKEFFSDSDEIFHTFSRDQVSQYYSASYRAPDNNSLEHNANICCLMAVAAVGAQYGQVVVDMGIQPYRSFYDIACRHVEAVLRVQPLNAIRVYALLCLYNIIRNTDEAIAYAGKPGLTQQAISMSM